MVLIEGSFKNNIPKNENMGKNIDSTWAYPHQII